MTNGLTSRTILVGLSGGVDSSVAAYLLKRRNYRVIGVFIRIFPDWLAGFLKKRGMVNCPWALDQRYARQVADKLRIPFYIFDLSVDYENEILANFLAEYRAGRTPNPDVLCNRFIKFGRFLEIAQRVGANYVATGHYVIKKDGMLLRGRDKIKDQSYFLWMIGKKQLRHSLFPLGEYTKKQVREIARKAKLPTAHKPDSQGICFLGQIKTVDFLKQKIKPRSGAVITTKGEKIGKHDGVVFFTLGQRLRGIKLDLKKSSFQGKDMPGLYVVEKDMVKNQLIVGRADDKKLFSKELIAKEINWIDGASGKKGELSCQIRYGQTPQKCAINPPAFTKCRNLLVKFEEKQRAIAPGQSVVFYIGDELLGGGIIEK